MADIGTNKLITLDAYGILEFSHHILEVLLISITIKIYNENCRPDTKWLF